MKKIVFGAIALLFIGKSTMAQDDKSFHFGLKAVPTITWYKPDDKKNFENLGSRFKFGYGLITEFKLAGSAWLSTGLEINYDGGNMKFIDSTSYFYNNDEFTEVNSIDFTDASLATKSSYLLRERKYNSTYLTIPVALRLRTKEIGAMTYYGNFGLLAGIHLKTRSDDVVNKYDATAPNGINSTNTEIPDLDITDDMQFIRFGLNLGAGLEYNLSGSTSIMAGLAFNQYFSNHVKKESKYLIDNAKTESNLASGNTKAAAQTQKFLANNIQLVIAVLF